MACNCSTLPSTGSTAVPLPPRRQMSTAGATPSSIWSIQPPSSPDGSQPSTCCKLLQSDESSEALLHKCEASSGAPTPHSRRTCCKDEVKPDRSLVSHEFVRDVIIGLSDGLMVPFALTAGLSSLGSSKLVYQAGFAELTSGAISMGIGGYLSAKSEQDIFRHRFAAISDRLEVACSYEIEREVHDVLGPLGVRAGVSRVVAQNLESVQRELAAREEIRGNQHSPSRFGLWSIFSRRPKAPTMGTSAFLIHLGEGMEEVPTPRLFVSAFTIGLSYFIGGLIPIIPYLCVGDALHGLYWSILATGITLILFGLAKSWFTGAAKGLLGLVWGALSMLAVGAAAAAASYGIVKALEVNGGAA